MVKKLRIVELGEKVFIFVANDKMNRGFTMTKAILRLMGFDWWEEVYERQPFWYAPVHILYFLFQWYNQLGVSMFGMIYVFRMEVKSDQDFSDMIKNVILCMTLTASSLKALFIYYKRREVKNLIDYVEGLGVVPGEEILNEGKNAAFYYYGVLMTNVLTWSIYSGVFRHGELPILTDYPWSIDNIPGFLVGYGMQVLSSMFCALSHGALDTLLPMSVCVVSEHLESLNARISRLGKRELGMSRPRDEEDITQFIKYHNKLLKAASFMNDTIGTVFMLQIFYVITHACIIIFLVVKVQDYGVILVNAMPLLTAAYAQLLLYCYFGQMLTSRFDSLTSTIHNNEWYNCDRKVRQALYTIGEVCKRPVQIVGGGGVFHASHETYLTSLQESVSYFLFLKTMTSTGDQKP